MLIGEFVDSCDIGSHKDESGGLFDASMGQVQAKDLRPGPLAVQTSRIQPSYLSNGARRNHHRIGASRVHGSPL
jgi:hypothetical protein